MTVNSRLIARADLESAGVDEVIRDQNEEDGVIATPVEVSATNYTLLDNPAAQYLMLGSSVQEVTIPEDTANIRLGAKIDFYAIGASGFNIVGEAGVTVNAPSGVLPNTVQYSKVTATKIAETIWVIN